VVVPRWTQRQAQILELAALGQSDKQIAASLGLSTHTIRTHLQRLYRTRSLSNRAEAVAAWLAQRQVDDGTDLQEKEAVLVHAAALPVQSLPAPAQGDLINQFREQSGLQPLAWREDLAELAQASAARMATQGYLDTIIGNAEPASELQVEAENTGYWSGINDLQMHSMFAADPKQRANILGPHTYVGAGWSLTENGVAFLSVLFAQ
jgi:DNA-binding CsgD family transcriptional regulator